MKSETVLQKNLSTFQMGETPLTLYKPSTVVELQELIQMGVFKSTDCMVQGEGSNTIFVDTKITTIVRYSSKEIKKITETDTDILYTVGAGLNWDEFVRFAVSQGLWGIENLALIPGTVGASPVQNIGAYGSELKDTLESVEYIDLVSGEQKILKALECKLGYRNSIFKQELKNKTCIVSVTFRLSKIPKPNIGYKDVEKYMADHNLQPTLSTIYDAICSIRKSKLADPLITPNCGSFFKNPVINLEKKNKLIVKYPTSPIYPYQHHFKISAAWCIDQCGLKGYTLGGVRVLESQPLVLTNYNNATPKELLETIDHIKVTVHSRFGILLEEEVNLV
jgi:UDP-N-acetylmuramate dehydrogenase